MLNKTPQSFIWKNNPKVCICYIMSTLFISTVEPRCYGHHQDIEIRLHQLGDWIKLVFRQENDWGFGPMGQEKWPE